MEEVGDTVRVELAVDLTCQKCVSSVTRALESNNNVKNIHVNLEKQLVIVDTSYGVDNVVKLVESTGKRAVVMGQGRVTSGTFSDTSSNLGNAVAMLHEGNPTSGIRGVTRFSQVSMNSCIIDGTVDGLLPNATHKIGIHEYGDLSNGCDSCGDVFSGPPGSETKQQTAYGDMDLIESNEDGRSSFRITSNTIKVWEIIGRSMVLQTKQPETSLWSRLACGIIARSAGLFENSKRICACDGIPLWDERDVPTAGKARQEYKKPDI